MRAQYSVKQNVTEAVDERTGMMDGVNEVTIVNLRYFSNFVRSLEDRVESE